MRSVRRSDSSRLSKVNDKGLRPPRTPIADAADRECFETTESQFQSLCFLRDLL